MNNIIFHLLANQYLPFFSKRRSIMQQYLRCRKWQKKSNSTPLEVVIPCIERDIATLDILVKSIRKFLLHPVKIIYIVGTISSCLENFCKENNCQFIDENNVLPIKLDDVGEYLLNKYDRRGWIFQQLLKLGSDSFVNTQHYYVLDSDTVLTTPQSLLKEEKLILNTSDELHKPYQLIYENLLGIKPISPVSFVSHQMVFEKDTLTELKQKIEKHTGKIWYQAIIDSIDRNEMSSFSEYELYGNFLVTYHLDKVLLEYFFNVFLDRNSLERFSENCRKYQESYKSVSFHWHGVGAKDLN